MRRCRLGCRSPFRCRRRTRKRLPIAILNLPTSSSPSTVTLKCLILGTAAYMSPEQAKGRITDKRSDIWAFGCVFYEMLTAKRAFPGEDVSDTLAAVLKSEPDWNALPAALA